MKGFYIPSHFLPSRIRHVLLFWPRIGQLIPKPLGVEIFVCFGSARGREGDDRNTRAQSTTNIGPHSSLRHKTASGFGCALCQLFCNDTYDVSPTCLVAARRYSHL
jgi:hypothetical protein